MEHFYSEGCTLWLLMVTWLILVLPQFWHMWHFASLHCRYFFPPVPKRSSLKYWPPRCFISWIEDPDAESAAARPWLTLSVHLCASSFLSQLLIVCCTLSHSLMCVLCTYSTVPYVRSCLCVCDVAAMLLRMCVCMSQCEASAYTPVEQLFCSKWAWEVPKYVWEEQDIMLCLRRAWDQSCFCTTWMSFSQDKNRN